MAAFEMLGKVKRYIKSLKRCLGCTLAAMTAAHPHDWLGQFPTPQ